MNKRKKSAVVGLGSIGMNYDYDANDDNLILTHCKAFKEHPDFSLVAGVDISDSQRKLFEKKYKVKSYDTVSSLLSNEKLDVVSIAVPSAYHLAIFDEVIQKGITNILCEKPMGSNYPLSKEIFEKSKKFNINTTINYIRRFDPAIQNLKNWLEEGNIGEIKKIHVWYSGDLMTNASHYIDLILFLLDDELSVRKVIQTNTVQKGDFTMVFDNGMLAFFNSLPSIDYEHLVCDILGSKGRIKIDNKKNAIEHQGVEPNSIFPDYMNLGKKSILFKTSLTKYQYYVLDELISSIKNDNLSISNYQTAFETSKVLNMLKMQE